MINPNAPKSKYPLPAIARQYDWVNNMHVLLWVFGALFILTASPIHFAHAEDCIPGLPCDTDLTDNDPYDDEISPNTDGDNASKTTSDACDADFMNQIYGRAFLEAERENMLNQALIRKPDSVLEYTCFDQHVSATAKKGGELFSDSDHWDDMDVEIDGVLLEDDIDDITIDVNMCNESGEDPCDKLDKSLETLVLDSTSEYLDENFDHDFLGGKETGIDADIDDEIGDFYLCDHMNNTHFLAKCNDMVTDDQFYSFNTLINTDPRILPEQCQNGTDITQNIVDLAENKNFKYAAFDEVETYLDMIKGDGSNDCGDPIPLGIKSELVKVNAGILNRIFVNLDEHDDYVCANPACWYNPQNNACE